MSAYPEDDIVKLASQFTPKHEPLPEMLKDSEAATLLGIGRTKFPADGSHRKSAERH